MTAMHLRPTAEPLPRPRYVWLAVVLELFTALGAIPVGLSLRAAIRRARHRAAHGVDPGVAVRQLPRPGLYLLLMNGIGMLVLAGLSVARHPPPRG